MLRRRRAPVLLALVISIGYAATDEFHQSFVAGRHGSPVDVLIDSAGVALAIAVATASRAGWR